MRRGGNSMIKKSRFGKYIEMSDFASIHCRHNNFRSELIVLVMLG